MRTLVRLALDLRWVVTALSILLLIVGFRVIPNTPMDVFPEFSPLLVEIQTEAPGLSTAEVEALISTPIENALNGVKGMKIMRSKSVLGLSSVVLIFQEGVELMSARQLVQERLLTLTGQLPALARTPVVLSPLSSTSRVLKIGVWSNKLFHLFVIRAKRRNQLRAYLSDAGIETAIHYPVPLHRHPAFREPGLKQRFPVAEKACAELLSLPLRPTLSDDDVLKIAQHVRRFYGVTPRDRRSIL